MRMGKFYSEYLCNPWHPCHLTCIPLVVRGLVILKRNGLRKLSTDWIVMRMDSFQDRIYGISWVRARRPNESMNSSRTQILIMMDKVSRAKRRENEMVSCLGRQSPYSLCHSFLSRILDDVSKTDEFACQGFDQVEIGRFSC